MTDSFNSGDWVQVVKPEPCCGNQKYLGLVFKVEQVAGPKHFGFDLLYCGTCMATTSNPIVWKSTVGDILGFTQKLSRNYHLSSRKNSRKYIKKFH